MVCHHHHQQVCCSIPVMYGYVPKGFRSSNLMCGCCGLVYEKAGEKFRRGGKKGW
jgi:hypothetical protein